MAIEAEDRRRRTIELVIAGAVVAISLASLFTAVYQSIVMRRTLEASVWPRVEWENSNYDEQRRVNAITFAVSNHGVGPARIMRVEILFKGERVGTEEALLRRCCVDGTTAEERTEMLRGLTQAGHLMTFTSTLDGTAVAQGQRRVLFEFERPAADNPAIGVWDRLNRVRDELDLTVCYCSVFDDCWTAKARAYRQTAEQVDTCPSGREPGFIG
jgi:hypothetical protein